MSYNVQSLKTSEEINDFLFFLRRIANPERDTFLFLFGINNGLRMSDVLKLKIKDIKNERPWIVQKRLG